MRKEVKIWYPGIEQVEAGILGMEGFSVGKGCMETKREQGWRSERISQNEKCVKMSFKILLLCKVIKK